MNIRLRDDSGTTAAEYGLLVAFVAAVILLAVTFFGAQVMGLLQKGLDLL